MKPGDLVVIKNIRNDKKGLRSFYERYLNIPTKIIKTFSDGFVFLLSVDGGSHYWYADEIKLVDDLFE